MLVGRRELAVIRLVSGNLCFTCGVASILIIVRADSM